MENSKAIEQFEAWRESLTEFLEQFLNLFPRANRSSLDFSPQSAIAETS
jgi:hypothetical protein